MVFHKFPELAKLLEIDAFLRWCFSQGCRRFAWVAARLLHTIRRMLEASGGRFQSHSEANYDVLLEHYLVQMLLLYRVSCLCNAR